MSGRSQKKNTGSAKRKVVEDKPATPKLAKTTTTTLSAPAVLEAGNRYARYANLPWGPREFDPDVEFSGGRKVWGTSVNPHTRKIREGQGKLLGPLLAFERAKDWKRQKINRSLKAGIREEEHATLTGRPIGTTRKQLTDVQGGKFERLVQKTCEVIFVCKKAYILYQWYNLSNAQRQFYLDLEEEEDLPDFQIPDEDLEETGLKAVQEFAVVIKITPIDREGYARFDDLIE